MVIPQEIDDYAEAHTTPPPSHLQTLAAETKEAKQHSWGMMVGTVEGRLLEFLVRLRGARSILEIGMFTGYSALSMAQGMPKDGRIITCDIDPEAERIARRHFDASPYGDRIEIRLGPALDTIRSLEGPFDLVFIDADKTNYRNYFEAAMPKLADDGVIVVDNVLWSGRVLDTKANDDADTRAIAEFNTFVCNDPRVECVMLTVRDGVTLIRKADRR
jgi:caffeoyl-CoA O-methyltransferase